MSISKVLIYLSILCLLLFSIACANQSMPTGGPKDEEPPRVMATIPVDQSKNFKENTIRFFFDEYIEAKNFKNGSLITPKIDGDFEFTVRKNTLTLKFDKPFRENTTYVLDLGETIQDTNERNIASNIKLAFSTGDKIDTAFIQGTVTDALTLKPETKTNVSLYDVSDTVTIENGKPLYYTKTDSLGRYRLGNLKPGRYLIYALKEEKGDLIYNKTEEKIAFHPDTLDLEERPFYIVDLRTTKYDLRPFRINSKRPIRNYFELKANKNIDAISVSYADSTTQEKITYQAKGDVIRFYNLGNLNPEDSLKAYITIQDSIGNSLKDTSFIKFTESKEVKPGKFTVSAFPGSGTRLRPEEMKNLQPVLLFAKPILSINSDSLQFKVDKDTSIYLLEGNDLKWNKNKTELYLNKNFRAESSLSIKTPAKAFITVEKDSSELFEISYSLKGKEEHGTVSGEIRTEHTHFIIQLMDENLKSVEQELKNQKKFKFEYVTPGNKVFRILIDTNKNGIWDNGELKKRILPEPAFIFREVIQVKANWEYEDILIDLSGNPPPDDEQ